MEYTKEQLKAAYALNLCTVSISQIVDYNDANIMEQEYEAILNNLNLEQMPKDDALLNVLKQILDTITFFRIQEGDKKLIDLKYQQKMKNAIWSAVPNFGLLVSGGNPCTIAISLASQIGIGYMNYRRIKAENSLQYEEDMWQLERAAIEQFNGLRRELFDTAWRLAATYNFPDQLRLTERQIALYDNILMDDDPLRKYERMDSIKQHFLAYPPFWYHFGSTANYISRTMEGLDEDIRNEYRCLALDHFRQYRESNQYGLLRDDQVSASCALEMADMLDVNTDRELITELLDEAVSFSGRSNDVLQLAAVGYLRIDQQEKAVPLLKMLVNERYNTELNAQILSGILVTRYIASGDSTSRRNYDFLSRQIDEQYLYPMPEQIPCSVEELEGEFLQSQKEILKKKYIQTIDIFADRSEFVYDSIVLPYEEENDEDYDDDVFVRRGKINAILNSRRDRDGYLDFLQDWGLQEGIVELMNEIFASISTLDIINEDLSYALKIDIRKGLYANRTKAQEYQRLLDDRQLKLSDKQNLIDVGFLDITKQFFTDLKNGISDFVETREDLRDISIAEQNLNEFCNREEIPAPSITGGLLSVSSTQEDDKPFSVSLLGSGAADAVQRNEHVKNMLSVIDQYIDEIVIDNDAVEIYNEKDPRTERYFESNSRIANNVILKSRTLAILDDMSKKADIDLIFTSFGIVPVKGGVPRDYVLYDEVSMINGKKTGLDIGLLYTNEAVNKNLLFEMCKQLADDAVPVSRSNKTLMPSKHHWNLFK